MNIIIAPFSKKLPSGKYCAKDYPTYYWKQLIKLLQSDGHVITQVGIEGELQLCDEFIKDASEDELIKLIHSCDFFIGVDSYFQHLAWEHNKKGVVIWSKSDPNLFGHNLHLNILKDRKYLREYQFKYWHEEPYDIDAFLEPEEVYDLIKKEFNL